MLPLLRAVSRPGLIALSLTATLCLAHQSVAQSSGKGAEMHITGEATAAEVGLPAYPGAVPYKETGNDSSSVDLGLSFGDFHFRVIAASYKTADTAAKVLDFYRKPLARYGDVLECDHGLPVGPLKATRSGLTCSSEQIDSMKVNKGADSSRDRELRAGCPQRFRIVGIGDPVGGSTRFGMVLVELPKDSESGKKSD